MLVYMPQAASGREIMMRLYHFVSLKIRTYRMTNQIQMKVSVVIKACNFCILYSYVSMRACVTPHLVRD